MIPEPIQKFIENFSRLPSLGPRLVTRLAFYLLNLDSSTFKNLETSFSGLKTLDRCKRCFFFKETKKPACDLCLDQRRNKNIIAIVEKETDLLSLEKTGKFRGQYLVLGELAERGLLSSGQKLRLQVLKNRIQEELGGAAEEIIVAVSPNALGDLTADLIRREFQPLAKKISRLGRGIPTGGEIEFADEDTLANALEYRN